jgi:DNA-binding HxlR family transcriptional regulator
MALARRSYQQFCGLARALDVVGDRWTLLIVRELLAGPRRFGDLQAGLPGIASNLLTKRLRQLERDGLVARQLHEDPARGVGYVLTARGAELREAIDGLVRWSTPLMAPGPGGDAFRPEWLGVAVAALVRARPTRPIRIGLEAGDAHLVLIADSAGVTATPGDDERVHARLVADAKDVLALAAGLLDVRGALRRGARLSGDRKAIEAVFRSPLPAGEPGTCLVGAPPGQPRSEKERR